MEVLSKCTASTIVRFHGTCQRWAVRDQTGNTVADSAATAALDAFYTYHRLACRTFGGRLRPLGLSAAAWLRFHEVAKQAVWATRKFLDGTTWVPQKAKELFDGARKGEHLHRHTTVVDGVTDRCELYALIVRLVCLLHADDEVVDSALRFMRRLVARTSNMETTRFDVRTAALALAWLRESLPSSRASRSVQQTNSVTSTIARLLEESSPYAWSRGRIATDFDNMQLFNTLAKESSPSLVQQLLGLQTGGAVMTDSQGVGTLAALHMGVQQVRRNRAAARALVAGNAWPGDSGASTLLDFACGVGVFNGRVAVDHQLTVAIGREALTLLKLAASEFLEVLGDFDHAAKKLSALVAEENGCSRAAGELLVQLWADDIGEAHAEVEEALRDGEPPDTCLITALAAYAWGEKKRQAGLEQIGAHQTLVLAATAPAPASRFALLQALEHMLCGSLREATLTSIWQELEVPPPPPSLTPLPLTQGQFLSCGQAGRDLRLHVSAVLMVLRRSWRSHMFGEPTQVQDNDNLAFQYEHHRQTDMPSIGLMQLLARLSVEPAYARIIVREGLVQLSWRQLISQMGPRGLAAAQTIANVVAVLRGEPGSEEEITQSLQSHTETCSRCGNWLAGDL